MARARVKARFTILSKQAISCGYVVDMDVFQLGLLKKEWMPSLPLVKQKCPDIFDDIC